MSSTRFPWTSDLPRMGPKWTQEIKGTLIKRCKNKGFWSRKVSICTPSSPGVGTGWLAGGCRLYVRPGVPNFCVTKYLTDLSSTRHKWCATKHTYDITIHNTQKFHKLCHTDIKQNRVPMQFL